MMQISARQAALTALERSRRDKAWSGAVIDGMIEKNSLSSREASLAARLYLGVLQNSSLCDFYIDAFCGRKLEPKLRDILRLGVYQLLFLDRVPDRAAVSECVALCKSSGIERGSGLINAVLRKIASNKDSLPEIPGHENADYLSIRYSVPKWLAQRFISERGYEFSRDFFEACNQPSKLFLQVNTLKISVDDYMRRLENAEIAFAACPQADGCIMTDGGSVADYIGYNEGLFYVQDKAARLSVELSSPQSGMSVLDACAAPGGKSFASGIRMNNTGSILACDIHEKKLGLIRSGSERLGISIIETQCRDAGENDKRLRDSFDMVIADLPCSGFGVMGRKPEIRLKSEAEVAGLPSIQLAMLNNLSSYVKKGGVLMYSTCTMLKAENEDVVEEFLRKNANYCLDMPQVRTFSPNTDQSDGFFAARMKRIS